MSTNQDKFKKIVSHAKEYGFIFQSSEIYDGLSAVYDYAQNGVELKNNIKNYCILIYTEPPTEIFNNKLNRYAHKADIIRLEKLLEYGGIYLDIDVLTNKSFDDLLNTDKSPFF